MLHDLRFAFRLFRSHAGTASVAVFTLALGIGATSTVFGLFDAVFLRTLPAPAPERLVRLQLVTRDGRTQSAFSYPLLSDVVEQARAFAAVAGYVEGPATVRVGDYADRVAIEAVTSEYFALLGGAPTLGRAFTRAEEQTRDAVVVLSHALWQRAFNGDPSAIGATVLLNGRPFTIVGVAGERFHSARQASAPALWVPAPWFLAFVGMPDMVTQRGVGFLGIIGRLADGVTPAAASEETTALARRVEETFGDNRITTRVAARGDDDGVQALQGTARLVVAAALLLLVMACVNVMHILLAWGEERRREVAIRLALGGSRVRVVRQFLVESMALSLPGMTAGVLVAAWLLDLVPRAAAFAAAGVHVDARLDGRVLAASFAAAILSALFAGALPAWRAARRSVMHGIRRAAGAQGRWGAGSTLAVAQVALSLVLLMAAGLFTRSLSALRATDTNLAADRVLTLRAQFEMDATVDHVRGATDRILDGLRSLPGVAAAAAATTLPVSASGMRQRFEAGRTVPMVDTDMDVELQFVSPEYFATLGLPLAEGRAFSPGGERANAIIVNERFAHRYWPGESAIGRSFIQKSTSGDDDVLQIVGVARDTKYRRLNETAALTMYRPLRGFPTRTLALAIRTDRSLSLLARAARQRLQELEPGLTIWSVHTLEEHIDQSLAVDRARRTALVLFAGLALSLVCLGVYGIMAYSVSRRLREIGIRLALGAKPRAVGSLVLRRALLLVAGGIVAGFVVVYVAGQVIASQLHGVSPTDPRTLIGSGLLLTAVGLAASYLPARRASRVDPMAVLPLE